MRIKNWKKIRDTKNVVKWKNVKTNAQVKIKGLSVNTGKPKKWKVRTPDNIIKMDTKKKAKKYATSWMKRYKRDKSSGGIIPTKGNIGKNLFKK